MPTDMLSWLAIMGLAFVVIYWLMYGRRSSKGKPLKGGMWRYDRAPRQPYGSAQPAEYQHLLTACLGNRDKAERLIGYEQALKPEMDRDEAVRRALDRLQYDRS